MVVFFVVIGTKIEKSDSADQKIPKSWYIDGKKITTCAVEIFTKYST